MFRVNTNLVYSTCSANLWVYRKRRYSPHATQVWTNLLSSMEKPTLNVSLLTIVSLILLFEGPVRVAIEQICLHLMILSAKVRKLSETSKKWEDFLKSEFLPYPADIKNGYIYSPVLGVYVTTLRRLSLTILYHISYSPVAFFQPL